MEYVPFEIWAMTFSYLEQSDVRRFRQASRVFAKIGLAFLHIRNHFYFRKHSLERLERIAGDSTLSQNLKEIVFFVDMVAMFPSRDEWEAQARATCYPPYVDDDRLAVEWSQRYRLHKFVDLKVHDHYFKEIGWHLQQEIRREQESLLGSADTFISLQQSLSKLTNLRAFSLETFGPQSDEMRQLFILNTRQSWYCCNNTSALDELHIVSTRVLCAALAGRTANDPNRNVGSYLSTISISSTDFVNFHQYILDDPLCTLALNHIRAINLAPVYLNDKCTWTGRSEIATSMWKKATGVLLQSLLEHIPNLQSLQLSTFRKHSWDASTVFQNCSWSQLSNLTLSFVSITASSFEVFLSAHAICLKELRISNSRLIATGQKHAWIDLLRFIKDNLGISEIFLGNGLYENELGTRFSMDVLYVFRSGLAITFANAARFLVCGKYLSDKNWMRSMELEFLELTWNDLIRAYRTVTFPTIRYDGEIDI